MNWFESVENKLNSDKANIEAKQKKVNPDLKKLKNVNNLYDDDNFEEKLSAQNIDNTLQESKLLNYSITAASILFKEIWLNFILQSITILPPNLFNNNFFRRYSLSIILNNT